MSRYTIILLTLLAIGGQVTSSTPQLIQDESDNLFQQAVIAYNQKDYENAYRFFEGFLTQLDKNIRGKSDARSRKIHAVVHFWMGCSKYFSNEKQVAIDHLQRADNILSNLDTQISEYFLVNYMLGISHFPDSQSKTAQSLDAAKDRLDKALKRVISHINHSLPEFRKRYLNELKENSSILNIYLLFIQGRSLLSDSLLNRVIFLCDSLWENSNDLITKHLLTVLKAQTYLEKCRFQQPSETLRDRNINYSTLVNNILNREFGESLSPDSLTTSHTSILYVQAAYLKALCLFRIGALMKDEQRLDEAARLFEALKVFEFLRDDIYLRLGHVYLFKGNTDSAAADNYRRCRGYCEKKYYLGWCAFLGIEIGESPENKNRTEADFYRESIRSFRDFITVTHQTPNRRLNLLNADAYFRQIESEYFLGTVLSSLKYQELKSRYNEARLPDPLNSTETLIFNAILSTIQLREIQYEMMINPSSTIECQKEYLDAAKEFLKRAMLYQAYRQENLRRAQIILGRCQERIPEAQLMNAIVHIALRRYDLAETMLQNITQDQVTLIDERDYTLGRLYDIRRMNSSETSYIQQAINVFSRLVPRNSVCATFWRTCQYWMVGNLSAAVSDFWKIKKSLQKNRLNSSADLYWLKCAHLTYERIDTSSIDMDYIKESVLPLGEDNTLRLTENSSYFLFDEFYSKETIYESYRDQLLNIILAFDAPFTILLVDEVLQDKIRTIPNVWLDIKLKLPEKNGKFKISEETFQITRDAKIIEDLLQIAPYRFVTLNESFPRAYPADLMFYATGCYPTDMLYKFYCDEEDTVVFQSAKWYVDSNTIDVSEAIKKTKQKKSLEWIYDIEITPSNDFLIAGGSGVFKCSRDWKDYEFFPLLDKQIFGFDFYKEKIFCADLKNYAIWECTFGENGQMDSSLITKAFQPVDIFIDSDVLFIVEMGENRILLTDLEGKKLGEIRTLYFNGEKDSLDSPGGLLVKDGLIYACDSGNHRIVRFTQEGNIIPFKFGTLKWLGNQNNQPGFVLNTTGQISYVDGEFYFPHRLYIDEGHYIFVSDLSGRIQKFDQHGNFLQVIGRTLSEKKRPKLPAGLLKIEDQLYVVDREYNKVKIYKERRDINYIQPQNN